MHIACEESIKLPVIVIYHKLYVESTSVFIFFLFIILLFLYIAYTLEDITVLFVIMIYGFMFIKTKKMVKGLLIVKDIEIEIILEEYTLTYYWDSLCYYFIDEKTNEKMLLYLYPNSNNFVELLFSDLKTIELLECLLQQHSVKNYKNRKEAN